MLQGGVGDGDLLRRVHTVQGDQGGHDLGKTGGIHLQIQVPAVDHGIAVLVVQKRRVGGAGKHLRPHGRGGVRGVAAVGHVQIVPGVRVQGRDRTRRRGGLGLGGSPGLLGGLPGGGLTRLRRKGPGGQSQKQREAQQQADRTVFFHISHPIRGNRTCPEEKYRV